MTYEPGKDRLRSRRETYGSIRWNGWGHRKQKASSGQQNGTRRRFRLVRPHRATMLSPMPAARWKFRPRTQGEQRWADQPKAEETEQQDCRNAAHGDY
jgi:hypothetical protein